MPVIIMLIRLTEEMMIIIMRREPNSDVQLLAALVFLFPIKSKCLEFRAGLSRKREIIMPLLLFRKAWITILSVPKEGNIAIPGRLVLGIHGAVCMQVLLPKPGRLHGQGGLVNWLGPGQVKR